MAVPAYMALWDLPVWYVDFCLVDTPESLVGYRPVQLHMVSHIPERLRVTSWRIERDADKGARIFERSQQPRTTTARSCARI